MTGKTLYYKVARTTEQLCGLLGIAPTAVLRRMRWPLDFFENEGRGVTAVEFFEGWNAIVAEADRSDLPLFLGRAYARGPFNPAFFAFTCSETVRIGLERLALFKPLSGPLKLTLENRPDGLRIIKTSNTDGLALPASFSATELVFITEAIRTCTGSDIRPLRATLPPSDLALDGITDFMGCEITPAHIATLDLAPDDADRVLLSRDAAQWASMEPNFRRQLELMQSSQPVAARVRAALTDMLPAGQSSIGDAARQLRLSTRSLQRHLKSEGQSYQTLLDETRQGLALRYLEQTEMTIDEISYLLAYRDPNSFYRAFSGWTGSTPAAIRLKPSNASAD
ncbi:MAG: helix-turn-helix domain-containing protein [Paracoccaceae bacterium]